MCSGNCCEDAYTIPKGDTGEPGPQGEQGIPGNDGATGPQGADGATGPAGTPAFKYIKLVTGNGSSTQTFITASDYSTWVSGNLTDSVDGTTAIASDYSFTIYRFDGSVYYDAIAGGFITSVSVNPSTGAMNVIIAATYEGDQYRVVVVG